MSACPAKTSGGSKGCGGHGLFLDRLETGVVLGAIGVDEGRVDLVEVLEVVVLAVLTADVSRVEIASQSFVK